jgi:hypothetical protein
MATIEELISKFAEPYQGHHAVDEVVAVGRGAIPQLRQALQSSDAMTRGFAALALADFEEPDGDDLLVEILHTFDYAMLPGPIYNVFEGAAWRVRERLEAPPITPSEAPPETRARFRAAFSSRSANSATTSLRCSSLSGTRLGAKSLKSDGLFSHAGPAEEPRTRINGEGHMIGLPSREALLMAEKRQAGLTLHRQITD